MKKRILLKFLDFVCGILAGYFGYKIIDHNANAFDWCILAACLVVVCTRVYYLIKTANQDK